MHPGACAVAAGLDAVLAELGGEDPRPHLLVVRPEVGDRFEVARRSLPRVANGPQSDLMLVGNMDHLDEAVVMADD